MKRLAFVGVTAAAFLALGTALSGPSAYAGGTPCSVVDHGNHTSYSNLATAIGYAASGDSLSVKGTCYGNFVIISKDLTIAGQGGATLDAYGHGTVLQIWYSNVTLRGLTVTGGSAYNGGGISTDSSSTLTLHNTHVTNNSAGIDGGGIYNEGTLKLVHSTVSYNSAASHGGGVYNAGGASLSQNGPNGVTNNQPGNIYNGP